MASMAGLAAAMGVMGHQQQPGQQFAHQHQQQAYVQTPPVAQAPFQPPPQQFPPIAPGQEDLIKQVMSLPESELDRLDPAVRDQLLSLRRQYAGARF
jgi:Transcription termination and cleavage factor C-terminal